VTCIKEGSPLQHDTGTGTFSRWIKSAVELPALRQARPRRLLRAYRAVLWMESCRDVRATSDNRVAVDRGPVVLTAGPSPLFFP
jgi:hypothetical protein